ncbi:MAG: DUF3147 family protein [Thermoleophilia bacterium]
MNAAARVPGVYLLLKAVISGVLVVAASEAAKRSSLLGAVLISLPLTSILAITWLWLDTRHAQRVSDLSWSILWVILPSLAFFVALPVGLRAGLPFAVALATACAVTVAAYVGWVWVARRVGLHL